MKPSLILLSIILGAATTEKGEIADLVLLEANPVDDIKNSRHINAVSSMVGTFRRKH